MNTSRSPSGLAAFVENYSRALLEEKKRKFLGAIVLQYPISYSSFGMKQASAKAHEAALIVGSAIHHPADLRPKQGSCTHCARLQCYIQGAIGQVLSTQVVGSSGEGNDFGMSCDVLQLLSLIMATPDDLVVAYNNRSYGDFIGCEGFVGFAQRLLHEVFIAKDVEHGP